MPIRITPMIHVNTNNIACKIEVQDEYGIVRHSTLWLKPALVGQFEFAEWTPDGHLRHSKFVALREDKDAREVKREVVGT